MGGTIATPAGATDPLSLLRGPKLLDLIPADRKASIGEIEVLDIEPKRGSQISLEDVNDLAQTLVGQDGYVDGIVITAGTDTLEELAYGIALQVTLGIPVILTGAMRTAGDEGFDGARNLVAALRAARVPELTGVGPVVVMQDEIHSARWVTKMHTSSLSAFASPGHGPVGVIAHDRVEVFSRPCAGDFLGLPTRLDRRVEVVLIAAGADGLLIDVAGSSSDGLVLAGTGSGHLPPLAAEAAISVAEKIPVVLASRTGAGPVTARSFREDPGVFELVSAGLIPSRHLSPLKARLRLLVALCLGLSPRDVFATSERSVHRNHGSHPSRMAN
jgi:L-asparaginase